MKNLVLSYFEIITDFKTLSSLFSSRWCSAVFLVIERAKIFQARALTFGLGPSLNHNYKSGQELGKYKGSN